MPFYLDPVSSAWGRGGGRNAALSPFIGAAYLRLSHTGIFRRLRPWSPSPAGPSCAPAGAMNGESYVLLALGLLLVFVRTGYRVYQVGFKGWDVDDYLMPLAVVRRTRVLILPSGGGDGGRRRPKSAVLTPLSLRPPTQP